MGTQRRIKDRTEGRQAQLELWAGGDGARLGKEPDH